MIDIAEAKSWLEEEKGLLENELASVGKRNPSNPSDWMPTSGSVVGDTAEESEMADEMEELGTNAAILNDLEIRYHAVLRALSKIEAGTYGMCEISDHPIEDDRLRANFAARTCTAHMHNEESLPE